MADRTVGLTAARMVALTADPTVGPILFMARITDIGLLAGRAGFMVIATSGVACGIAGIRSATKVPVGTFAALTGNRRGG